MAVPIGVPGERFSVGFRGVAGVVVLWKMRDKGKGSGGGVGTGKESCKSMRKLCRNYPLATYQVPENRKKSEEIRAFPQTSDKRRIRLGCPSWSTFSEASRKLFLVDFGQKRVRLWDLWEGGLTALQEPTLTVLLALPKTRNANRNTSEENGKSG